MGASGAARSSDRVFYPPSAVGIGAGDLGRRVTVRSAVVGGFSDAVGELTQFDDTVVAVRRRDGEVVRLARGEVVAARLVPERLVADVTPRAVGR